MLARDIERPFAHIHFQLNGTARSAREGPTSLVNSPNLVGRGRHHRLDAGQIPAGKPERA
jgi:hypothetical protein